VGEQSGTVDSTGGSSAGTEAPDKKTKISESDIDGLKIFKFYDHPEIRVEIQVMKTEVLKYQDLAGSIKSCEERKDRKGKDTFDLSDWWKSNCVTLPGFTYVLRAVLTNSFNSCPPESLFILFNATYNDDQRSLTLTTLNYRCSHSLTNEACGSTVSR
jgi:hypothetical protein